MKISTRAIVGTLVGTVGATIVGSIIKSLLLFVFHNEEMKGLLFNPDVDFEVDHRERTISTILIFSAVIAMVYKGIKMIPHDNLKKFGLIVIVYGVVVNAPMLFPAAESTLKWLLLLVFAMLWIWYHFREKDSLKQAALGIGIAIAGGVFVSEILTKGGMMVNKGQLGEFLSEGKAAPTDDEFNALRYAIYQGIALIGFFSTVYFGFKKVPAKHFKWLFLFVLGVPFFVFGAKYKIAIAIVGFLAIYFHLRRQKSSEAANLDR